MHLVLLLKRNQLYSNALKNIYCRQINKNVNMHSCKYFLYNRQKIMSYESDLEKHMKGV